MPKGVVNQAGVPKPPNPAKVQAKNRTNMPRKPKISKLGDNSMRMNQKGMGTMKPPALMGGKKKSGVSMPKQPKMMKSKKPKTMESKKPKVPQLKLPDPVS